MKRCILDTNAIIALLQGEDVLHSCPNLEWVGISIISVLEFLSFPNLATSDRKLFDKFITRVTVIDLSAENIDYLQLCVSIRKENKLKLPDALIAAAAIQNKATLITKDKQLLGIENLKVIGW